MDLSSMFLAPPEIAKALGIRRQSVNELARKWQGGRKRQNVTALPTTIHCSNNSGCNSFAEWFLKQAIVRE